MGWTKLASSVMGTSHSSTGISCQDSCSVDILPVEDGAELVIAAVADGAGSSKFSGEGSAFICQAFQQEIKDHLSNGGTIAELDANFGRMFLEYCQEQLRPMAEARNEAIREFASTFIGCVAGDNESVFFQIGDGGAVYSTVPQPGEYRMAIPSAYSEYANVTQFVTDSDAAVTLRFSRIELDLSRIALFTDGLQNLAVDYTRDDHGIPFAPFFNPMFEPLSQVKEPEFLEQRLQEFLSSESVNRRTDDDKTLVLISQT